MSDLEIKPTEFTWPSDDFTIERWEYKRTDAEADGYFDEGLIVEILHKKNGRYLSLFTHDGMVIDGIGVTIHVVSYDETKTKWLQEHFGEICPPEKLRETFKAALRALFNLS